MSNPLKTIVDALGGHRNEPAAATDAEIASRKFSDAGEEARAAAHDATYAGGKATESLVHDTKDNVDAAGRRVGQTVEAGRQSVVGAGLRAGETAKEGARRTGETLESGRQAAVDTGRKAGDTAKEAARRAGDTLESGRQAAVGAGQRVGEGVNEGAEKAKEGGKNLLQKAGDLLTAPIRAVTHAGQKTTEAAEDVGDAARETAGEAGRRTRDTVDSAGRRVGETLESGRQAAVDTGRKAGDTAKEGARRAGDTLESGRQAAVDTGRKAGEGVSEGAEKAKEGGQSFLGGFTDTVSSPFRAAKHALDETAERTKEGVDASGRAVDERLPARRTSGGYFKEASDMSIPLAHRHGQEDHVVEGPGFLETAAAPFRSAKDAVGETLESGRQAAVDTGRKAGDTAKEAARRAGDTLESGRQAAVDTGRKAGEGVSEGAEKAKEGGQNLLQKAGGLLTAPIRAVTHAGESAKETAEDAGRRARDTVESGRQKVADTVHEAAVEGSRLPAGHGHAAHTRGELAREGFGRQLDPEQHGHSVAVTRSRELEHVHGTSVRTRSPTSLTSAGDQQFEGAKELAAKTTGDTVQSVRAAAEETKKEGRNLLQRFGDALSGPVHGAQEAAVHGVEALGNLQIAAEEKTAQAGKSLGEATKRGLGAVGGATKGTAGAVAGTVGGAAHAVQDTATGAAVGTGRAVGGAAHAVQDTAGAVVKGTADAAKGTAVGAGKVGVGAFEGTAKGFAGGLEAIGSAVSSVAGVAAKPLTGTLREAADVSTGYTSRTVHEIHDKEQHRIDHRPEDYPHARAATAAEFEKKPALEQVREAFLPETDKPVENLLSAFDQGGKKVGGKVQEAKRGVQRAWTDEPAGPGAASGGGEDLLLKLGRAAEDVIEGGKH